MKFSQRLGIFPYLMLGIALMAIGYVAIQYVVNNFWPVDTSRIDLIRAVAQGRADAVSLLEAPSHELIFAFLAMVLVMATGAILPIAYFLNKRFGRLVDERFGASSATPFLVILRQAMGVGFWLAFCVWLQMNRALGIGVALLVAAILVLFEMLLQIRNRAASFGHAPH